MLSQAVLYSVVLNILPLCLFLTVICMFSLSSSGHCTRTESTKHCSWKKKLAAEEQLYHKENSLQRLNNFQRYYFLLLFLLKILKQGRIATFDSKRAEVFSCADA